MSSAPTAQRVLAILAEAKRLAQEYRSLTGRPLGITGEVAEYEAVRLLDLEMAPVRQSGYDAVRRMGDTVQRLQIKGRLLPSSGSSGQLGIIRLDREWDAVLMVLLDEDFDVVRIYEADRALITVALTKPGSKARERGSLAVSKFASIGQLLWSRG